jgi:TonB-linked SusC/RagA family outer membrane protein
MHMSVKLLIKSNLTKAVLLGSVMMLSIFRGNAQDTNIVRGTILSHLNQPVPQATVNIDGSSQLPVLTNHRGEFSLTSTSGEDWIIISAPEGYKQKRVFLNNRSRLTIYLTADDMSSGDDQLLILTQSVRKRNMVSSYSELDIKDIQQSPVHSIDQYMQGRIPGMYVINRSGDPASGAYTMLRGVNSLNVTNLPLYVIDGIPLTSQDVFGSNLDGFTYNPLMGLNLSDISKISVIKDQSVAAAYGSKAPNGLIIIETLDPSVTQTTIDVSMRAGYSLAPPRLIPQLDAEQHKTLMNEVLFSSGVFEELLREEYPNLFPDPEEEVVEEEMINYRHNTNWQELIFRNSSLYNMNIMVKGGDEIARYGLSFGYLNSKGIIRQTGYQGYNLRFVSRLNIFTWLKMDASVSLNKSASQLKEAATVSETSPVMASLAKSPLLNPYQYDIDGFELTTLAEVNELGISNPVAIIDNYEAKNSNHNFIATLGFESTLSDNLTINSKFSLNYDVLKEQIFMPNKGMELYYNEEAINVSKATNNSLMSLYNNTYLKYNMSFGKNHQVASNTGVNILSNNYQYDWGLTKNAHENDEYRMLQDGQNALREVGGDNRKWNWMSFYENITYSYKDKYLAMANLSVDGSSRLGENADNTISIGSFPFGLFYSGGVAWRISNESFLKNVYWLEDLKLRLTAGKAGNDDVGESSSEKYYNAIRFRETVGLYPAVIQNDRLTYETVSQLNAGIDFAAWGNRFRAAVDVFSSVSDNMIIFKPVAAYIGYDYQIENGGKMSNRGWEFYTFSRLIDRNGFKWDLQVNLSPVKNEILEIDGNKLVYNIEGAEKVNIPGSAVYSFYGYIFKGVYATQEEADAAGLINDKSLPYQAGDAIYEDISGPGNVPDGIIDDFDKTTIGSSLPDLTGGMVNTICYKRWALSAFIQFVSGNDVFNYVRYKNESMSGLENQSQNVLNRWQYEGQETDIPRALYDDPMGNSSFSTRWIEDGSYLRVKSISLSYMIPDKFTIFNNAEFYVSANNIFTLTKYLGYDPEFAFSYRQVHHGIDYGMTPQCRQFIAGIRIGL